MKRIKGLTGVIAFVTCLWIVVVVTYGFQPVDSKTGKAKHRLDDTSCSSSSSSGGPSSSSGGPEE